MVSEIQAFFGLPAGLSDQRPFPRTEGLASRHDFATANRSKTLNDPRLPDDVFSVVTPYPNTVS
ncbi:hypothetical protein J2Z75_004116 [Rhizobium herbae]|uniref:Uncharacterized protein n=1 Tax=Rhizobium herbae TaxID=508661 RepID=A0ABS4ERL6_9HYPH|nr:hypothetical protein [Rhizobium herbae]